VKPKGIGTAKVIHRHRPHALRGNCRIAFACARIPPAAGLDRTRRIAHIDDAVELVVPHMRRLEIRRAARAMDKLAIDEPQAMHAARMRTGRIEK
jgi:hypothetical protein